MSWGIHYTGRGDSWFAGLSKAGNASFDSREKAVRFSTVQAAEQSLLCIPDCVRKWFAVEVFDDVQ